MTSLCQHLSDSRTKDLFRRRLVLQISIECFNRNTYRSNGTKYSARLQVKHIQLQEIICLPPEKTNFAIFKVLQRFIETFFILGLCALLSSLNRYFLNNRKEYGWTTYSVKQTSNTGIQTQIQNTSRRVVEVAWKFITILWKLSIHHNKKFWRTDSCKLFLGSSPTPTKWNFFKMRMSTSKELFANAQIYWCCMPRPSQCAESF